jgi:ribosomal protein L19E
MKRDDMTPKGTDSRTRYRGRSESEERKEKEKGKERENGVESGRGNGKRRWWRKIEEVRHRGCS